MVQLKVGTLSLKWAEEFRDKLNEARALLKGVAHLAHTTMALLEFVMKLRDHPGVENTTKVQFGLVAAFQTDNPKVEGGKETHTLEIAQGMCTAPVMIQALSFIASEHCDNLKHVEQDTPKLQEVLGAVSEFKDAVVNIGVNHPGCEGCGGCGDGEDEGEPQLN